MQDDVIKCRHLPNLPSPEPHAYSQPSTGKIDNIDDNSGMRSKIQPFLLGNTIKVSVEFIAARHPEVEASESTHDRLTEQSHEQTNHAEQHTGP